MNSDRKLGLGEVDFGHEAVVDLYTIMKLLPRRGGPRPRVCRTGRARASVPDGRQQMARPARLAPSRRRRAKLVPRQRRHSTSRFCDGRLVDAPPSDGWPADEWLHDPDRPVPFITGASSAQIGGPDDFAGVETRGDVLVFTGEALTEPVDLIGPVRLVAHVSTSAADTDITAKLLDVHQTASRSGCATVWSGCASAAAMTARCPSTRAPCTRSRSRCGTPRSGSCPVTGSGSRSRAPHIPSSR